MICSNQAMMFQAARQMDLGLDAPVMRPIVRGGGMSAPKVLLHSDAVSRRGASGFWRSAIRP